MFSTPKFDIEVLHHEATNNPGAKLRGYIQHVEDDEFKLYEVTETGPRQISHIDLTIPEKNVVFINDMESYNRNNNYKGVGKLLHEFVFYYLATKNINYPIQLSTAFGSPVFHYKCGYRFLENKFNQLMEGVI